MRLGSREYRQFVGIARGSAGEVCYHLLLARDLKYISDETYQELRSGYDRVVQMLSRLSQSLGDASRSPVVFQVTPTSTNTTLILSEAPDAHDHVTRPRSRRYPFGSPPDHESRSRPSRSTPRTMQVTRAAFQAQASLNTQATDPMSHTLVRTFYTGFSSVLLPAKFDGRPRDLPRR